MIGEQKNHYLLTLVFVLIILSSFGILQNSFADTVTTTIQVGNLPLGVAVNPNTNMIYVSNEKDNTVSVIDGSTNSVVNTIQVGTGPHGIGVNPNTDIIYVADSGHYDASLHFVCGSTVSVIDGSTNSVVNTIQVGNCPDAIGVNLNTNIVYVTNQSNAVNVINGTTDNVVGVIPVGSHPSGVGVNLGTNMIYVTNLLSNTVTVVNGKTNTVVGTVEVGSSPSGISVNANTNKIYVENWDSNTVSVIDGSTNSVVNTIQVGTGPGAAGVNPSTNKIYVANSDGNTVSVIDGSTNSVVNTIPGESGPSAIGVNPSTNKIYVANSGGASISVIDDISSPNTTSTLAVNSQDSLGNSLLGFYAELYSQNGTQIDAGYTPYNFTLDNGQNYTIHVENYGTYKFSHWADTGSTNASRDISISADQSITAIYATIPTHPTNLTATAVSSSEIDLNWNTPSSDGGSPITGYRIQESTDDSTWTTIVKNTGNTNTAYSDTGLSDNTTYYYRVFALNSVGSSYRSNIADATTPILTVAGTNIGPVNTTLP